MNTNPKSDSLDFMSTREGKSLVDKDMDKRVEKMRSEFKARLRESLDALEAILGHTPTFSQYIEEVMYLNVISTQNWSNYLQGFGMMYSEVTGEPSYFLDVYRKLVEENFEIFLVFE